MSLSVDAFPISDTTLSTVIWTGLHLSYNEDGNKHGLETFDVLCCGCQQRWLFVPQLPRCVSSFMSQLRWYSIHVGS